MIYLRGYRRGHKSLALQIPIPPEHLMGVRRAAFVPAGSFIVRLPIPAFAARKIIFILIGFATSSVGLDFYLEDSSYEVCNGP